MLRFMLFRRRHASILLAAGLALACFASASAQNDPEFPSPMEKEIPIWKGRLDFDYVADTMFGMATMRYSYLPLRIHWGSVGRSGQRITTIKYPNWEEIDGSISLMDMNKDTLTDMLFVISGIRNDSVVSKAIVIFGQDQILGRNQINLNQITRFQVRPFYAMYLVQGEELTDPDYRDPSGKKSWLINPLEVNVRDTSRQEPIVSGIAEEWVNVYPNPAVWSASIELQRIPPGEYHIVMSTSNGAVYAEQSVSVDDSGQLFRSFDLSEAPNGYYIIQVFRAGRQIGAYPVVIVH